MSYVYYLVGPPGSGKRTVGLALSRLTGAVLLDNHMANDPVFTAYGVRPGQPIPDEVWRLTGQVRDVLWRAARLARPTLSHIFTNYLTQADSEWAAVQRLRTLAEQRGAAFVPVWLSCPLDELQRRMARPERAERLKIRDAVQLQTMLDEYGTLPAPPDAIRVNTAEVSPADAALLIASHAGARW